MIDLQLTEKIKKIISVDVNDVVKDAQAAGLPVTSIACFSAPDELNYRIIKKIMDNYASTAAKYCALSGAGTGIGGLTSTIALASVDIANIAAQLFRLNQRLAILSGLNPEDPDDQKRINSIYLRSLGFDDETYFSMKEKFVNSVRAEPQKETNLLLILEVTKYLGIVLSKIQITKIIPFLGAIAGSTLNFFFAKKAAKQMIHSYECSLLLSRKEVMHSN